MKLITTEVLLMIAPHMTRERAQIKVDAMNELLPKYGITNQNEFEEYLANVLHETGGFRIRTESMNYTLAQRIVEIWPSRFNLTGTGGRLNANLFVRQPVKLANAAYNGRMGNRSNTNDGFDFRGGGDPQLTGRDAYTLFASDSNRTYNKKLSISEWANLIRESDYWAVAAGGFFYKWKNIGPMARTNNMSGVVVRWNGGKIGMADRLKWLGRCNIYLPLVNQSIRVVRTSSGSNVNVRAGAGTNHGIIGSIPNGSQITVLNNSNGWSEISFGNIRGFVSSQFIV